MTTKMLKALKASIRHWRRLRDGKQRNNEIIGTDYCSLCKACGYKTPGDSGACFKCPVYQKTWKEGCRGTPYNYADEMWEKYGIDSVQFRSAAAAEVYFLESLLPEGEEV